MTARRRRTAGALLAGTLVAALAACGGTDDGSPSADPSSPSSPPSFPSTPPGEDGTGTPRTPPPGDLDAALSEPQEDSVYPDVGDPSVDALHYDLDLTWDPVSDTLTGHETLVFRATGTADTFQLDLAEPLEVASLTVDGEPVDHEHRGKDLVVSSPTREDTRYTVEIDYEGRPRPVQAPTARTDLLTVGLTVDRKHQAWTMQEPFGAYTWYAVNDQPSDKALYDFTLHVPDPWVGIANGEQTEQESADGVTTTGYHLSEPAASYLVTVAFGDYEKTEDEGPGGVPITYWIPAGKERFADNLATMPDAMSWIEQYLGPYPFDSAGIVLVDSESGMETQTMITLGSTPYSTSPATIVHELVHQWYGDQVTPNDWRDVWMNEGMAMYLQWMWEAEQKGVPLDDYLDGFAPYEASERAQAGPPGDYDKRQFGSSNIYFGPALMWHELRGMLGDTEFFSVIRGWPQSQDDQSTDRETFLAYLEDQTGRDLEDFWDSWLLDRVTPERG